jgi:hypothetical protein
MSNLIGDARRQKRDELAKEFVMELLRKARPMSMNAGICTSMAASAYRLADCMLLASTMPTAVEAQVEPAPKRFITENPQSVYGDGLWVNVNLDLDDKFLKPSFVTLHDTVKIIRSDDSVLIFNAGEPADWADVKSFRKVG